MHITFWFLNPRGRDRLGDFDLDGITMLQKVKSKAVQLHAMEADGGRGGIAPTHS
jgi:hypothetical protein